MKKHFDLAFSSFVYTFFSPLCIHCKNVRQSRFLTLCKECIDLVQLERPCDRCQYCFELEESGCSCRKKHTLRRIKKAFCFDTLCPISSCYIHYVQHNKSYFSGCFGAFLYLQMRCLSWDCIDVICYFSSSYFERLKKGFDPNYLIAKQLSKYFKTPSIVPIKQKRTGFFLKKQDAVFDKRVLLIDSFAKKEELYANLFEDIFIHQTKDFRILSLFDKFPPGLFSREHLLLGM